MKYVASISLRDVEIDFRDLLGSFDRNIFKAPFVPKVIWEALGNKFNLDRWNKKLTKYRVRLIMPEETRRRAEVLGTYYNDDCQIEIEIHCIDMFKTVSDLKFEVIQTIMHEMVHANQFFTHPDLCSKVLEKQGSTYTEYHSTVGEIEAFAHCIALDFMEAGRWGVGENYTRYKETTPKIRRALHKKVRYWMKAYESVVRV